MKNLISTFIDCNYTNLIQKIVSYIIKSKWFLSCSIKVFVYVQVAVVVVVVVVVCLFIGYFFLFNRARTHLNQITKSFILYCGGGGSFFFIRKVCFLVPLLLIHSFIYFISSLIWLFQFHYIKCSLFFLYLCVYSGGDLMRWGCVFFYIYNWWMRHI